jgi:hypothetical protein
MIRMPPRILCVGFWLFLLCAVTMAESVMPVTVIVSGVTSVVGGGVTTLRARSHHGFLPYRKYVWDIDYAAASDTGDKGTFTDQQEHGTHNEFSTVIFTAPQRAGCALRISVSVTDDAGNTDADAIIIAITDP